MPPGTTAGAVSKTLTNEYWRLLGEGYQNFGKKVGVPVSYQAAQSEGDQLGQLSIAETMITQGASVLLVSPQTNSNLEPAIGEAKAAGIPVLNVNDAVIPTATHYVGNVQRDNGVRVAKWFLANRPQGGKVAVIEGQAGVYAAGQHTDGFKSTITAVGDKFQVVASVPGNWDRQLSYDAATTILQQHPDLIGFYCNNDTMALGVVEAVKNADLLGKVVVFGTDGISDAYASIRARQLTGTVDSFPVLTDEVAMEAAPRIFAKEDLPRVVATPQALITEDNVERYKGKGIDVRAVLEQDAKSGQ
jgi:ribose transport system substrate-binding protein